MAAGVFSGRLNRNQAAMIKHFSDVENIICPSTSLLLQRNVNAFSTAFRSLILPVSELLQAIKECAYLHAKYDIPVQRYLHPV